MHFWQLNLIADYCGQCGGDNSTCEHVFGEYDEAREGYRAVVRIPAGSSNIDIRQYGYNGSNEDNYLGIITHFWCNFC